MTIHPALIALMVVALVAVGVYIGVSGLVTQYALDTGNSSAGGIACAPASANGLIGKPVMFAASGIPSTTTIHWSSNEGRTEVSDGKLSATYTSVGKKTASVFWFGDNRWNRTTCSVQVR